MAVFNQTPGGQAPFAATLPILALGTPRWRGRSIAPGYNPRIGARYNPGR